MGQNTRCSAELHPLPLKHHHPLHTHTHTHTQAMGELLLTLACSVSGGAAPPSLELAAAHFSPDLARCLALLLGAADGGAFSWRHFAALAGERLMVELDGLGSLSDALAADLSRELENGRLLRLLVKLGFVSERPEGDAVRRAAMLGAAGCTLAYVWLCAWALFAAVRAVCHCSLLPTPAHSSNQTHAQHLLRQPTKRPPRGPRPATATCSSSSATLSSTTATRRTARRASTGATSSRRSTSSTRAAARSCCC